MGFGDTRCQHPVTHLSLWSWLSRFTLGMEEMRKVMGKQNKCSGAVGGGSCAPSQMVGGNAAVPIPRPQEHTTPLLHGPTFSPFTPARPWTPGSP